MKLAAENFRKVDLKRKVFAKGKSKGGGQKFKRFKRTPKYIRDNPENAIARQKDIDAYHFTESSDDDGNDLGMGLEISDLAILDENYTEKQKQMITLTQDTVRPLFTGDADFDVENKLNEALAELKHSSFRPYQKETVKRILFGRSTLFISPTGSGKSLCYQLPALLYWRYRKYMTIVVSPLIALMEDQMKNLPKSINAVSLHSNHSLAQRRKSIKQLVDGEAQIAFISPEAIVGGLLNLDDLKSLPPIGFVCIDEAHCLSEWSHNFRPAYLQFFKILHEHMKIKTYLGLTATATKATSFAISRSLIINPETDVLGATTIPDNLILSVSYEVNKEAALIDLLKTRTFRIMTSIIVYCNRREDTMIVASRIRTAMQDHSSLIEVPERKKVIKKHHLPGPAINQDDSTTTSFMNDSHSSLDSTSSDKSHMKLTWNAEAYHAGLSSEQRKNIQRQFIKGELRVVVATVAFGMGINKSNIGAIIHYDMPSSFESYVQEIGRAGRDGTPAQCHMFLKNDRTDIFYQQRNIYSSITERKNLKKLTEYLFKPCSCLRLNKPSLEEEEKFRKLNNIDKHKIKSEIRTKFFDKPIDDESDSDDDDVCFEETNNKKGEESNGSEDNGKENQSSSSFKKKFVHNSIVRKHRHCPGHEKSFSIVEATNELNLKVESIITLICQLQRAYPQLKISQHTPTRSTCNIFCYNGTEQMKALERNNQIVRFALFEHKRNHLKAYGIKLVEIPNKLTFNIIEAANVVGKPSSDATRLIKATEWELVEKTGKFRRSQIKVSFEGNDFHVSTVGDLNKEEVEELDEFLYDYTKLYERIEREKIAKVFHTLRKHSISLSQMTDKKVRLEASSRLKTALNAYFSRSQKVIDNSGFHQLSESKMKKNSDDGDDDDDEECCKLSKNLEESIRRKARAFITAHKGDFTPPAIARIFQGISTPKFPAEIYGLNRKWWRCHIDVDFKQLTSLVEDEFVRLQAPVNH